MAEKANGDTAGNDEKIDRKRAKKKTTTWPVFADLAMGRRGRARVTTALTSDRQSVLCAPLDTVCEHAFRPLSAARAATPSHLAVLVISRANRRSRRDGPPSPAWPAHRRPHRRATHRTRPRQSPHGRQSTASDHQRWTRYGQLRARVSFIATPPHNPHFLQTVRSANF